MKFAIPFLLALGLVLPLRGEPPPSASGEALPSHRFQRPGLDADRETRVVRLEVRATGVLPDTETEFFLIAPNSGHDYEAIAIAKSKPSDVQAAMEFIGLTPGRPVHPDALYFWPRGERIIAWVERENGERMRLEDTIWNRRTDSPSPQEGFVFTGSIWTEEPLADGTTSRKVYAADTFEPNSIISAFNLRTTVFDIPRVGSKEDLYPIQVAHKGAAFQKDEPLIISLEPERRSGPPRVLSIRIQLVLGVTEDPQFIITEESGTGHPAAPASNITARLEQWQEDGRDVFAELDLPEQATLAQARAASLIFSTLVNAGKIRPEPPSSGGFYFRAFLPNPAMKIRAPNQKRPWEIHFRGENQPLRLVLSQNLVQDDGVARLEEKVFDAENPEAAVSILAREGSDLPALLLFAPPDTTLKTLRENIEPLREKHPHLFLFEE